MHSRLATRNREAERSGVGGVHLDRRRSIPSVLHVHQDRTAADVAILDVLLLAATSGVERDFVRFATVRAIDVCLRLGGTIAKGEVGIEIRKRPIVLREI